MEKVTRKCLRCDREFRSDGAGNRICGHCKKGAEPRLGAAYWQGLALLQLADGRRDDKMRSVMLGRTAW